MCVPLVLRMVVLHFRRITFKRIPSNATLFHEHLACLNPQGRSLDSSNEINLSPANLLLAALMKSDVREYT